MVGRAIAAALAAWVCLSSAAPARSAPEGEFIVLASTTSTDNSGLFADILPRFQEQSGIEVRVVAVDGMKLTVRAEDEKTDSVQEVRL